MAKKSKTPEFKTRQKLLKKIGVIKHNLKKKPTSAQRSEVYRKWKKYSHVAKSPKNYTKKRVADKTLKLFKKLDYTTTGNTVFINNEGFNKVVLKRKKINGKMTTIVQKVKADKWQEDLIVPPDEIFDYLESYEKKRLPAGEFLTVAIGNNSRFRSRFKSMKQLQHYLDNVFSPQQPLNKKLRRSKKEQEELKQELISQMSIIKFQR